MASKLLMSCGLVSSGSEAKRMVKQGGVSINGNKSATPMSKSHPLTVWSFQVWPNENSQS